MTAQGDGLQFRYFDPRTQKLAPPTTEIHELPVSVVCINKDWLGFVDGVLDRLAWSDVWSGTDEEIDFAIQQVYKLMASLKGDCVMFQLRQSPTVDCLLEQSIDGGETWIPAYDYSLCQPQSSAATDLNIQINAGLAIANHIAIRSENPSAYAPNVQADDENTNASYCFALHTWVYSAIEALIARKENDNQSAAIFSATQIAANLVAAIMIGGILGVVVVALTASVLLVAQVLIDNMLTEDLEAIRDDEDAIARLVCCAYEELENKRVGPVVFEEMWDGDCNDLTSNEDDVRVMFQSMVESFEMFIAFLDMVNSGVTLVESGMIDDLCIGCTGWCANDDWTGGADHDWSTVILANGAGIFQAGGVLHEDLLVGGVEARRVVNIQKDFDTRMITNIDLTASVAMGVYDDVATALVFAIKLAAGSTTVYSKDNFDIDQGDDTLYSWENLAGEEGDGIQLFIRSSHDTAAPWNYSGSVVFKDVEICGGGTLPVEFE